MKNAIIAEFIKLRRSGTLLLAAIASALPPAVKCLKFALGNTDEKGWTGFLSSGQELCVFGMLNTVMLLSAYLFTMEYPHGTADAIFTTSTKRTSVFAAKIAALAAVILSLLLVSAVSQLIFGTLAAGIAPAAILGQFTAVTAW
jgi:hypothetical protein